MLSAAKHLAADRDRPFAEFTLSEAHGLRMTGIISKYLFLGEEKVGIGTIEAVRRKEHVARDFAFIHQACQCES